MRYPLHLTLLLDYYRYLNTEISQYPSLLAIGINKKVLMDTLWF